MARVAVLTAIAAVLMLLEFPLWFAPGFYKLDLSESVILMGGFALGPGAAILIEFLKNLINILLNGTTTAYIGEMANFITGCAFVVPAAVIYKYQICKTFDTRLYKSIAKVEHKMPLTRLNGATAQTTNDFRSVTSGLTAAPMPMIFSMGRL